MSVNFFQNAGSPALRSRALAFTVGFGILSATLYFLLFYFSAELVALAKITKNYKIYALVPIALAMLFVFVQDAFTENFWDLVGLRVKN